MVGRIGLKSVPYQARGPLAIPAHQGFYFGTFIAVLVAQTKIDMADKKSVVTSLAKNCVLVCLSILTTNTWAATFTFDQALQAALSSHPLVQGKRSAQAAAKAELEGADWQRYPTPSIEANTASGGDKASVFRLDQPIWNGGRIQAGIDAAGSRHSAASTAIDEARQELALKVRSASSEVLRLRERLLRQHTVSPGYFRLHGARWRPVCRYGEQNPDLWRNYAGEQPWFVQPARDHRDGANQRGRFSHDAVLH
jgi:hypothetical protein